MPKFKEYYFSHARTALKYGLKSLDLKDKDEILVPDYICEAMLHPLNDLKLKFSFYKIKFDFNPNINDLKKKINKISRAHCSTRMPTICFPHRIHYEAF